MKHFLIIIFGFCGITLAHAGNLSNGQWQPTGCGQKSPIPTFNTQGVDAYNKSVKEVMAWQATAQEYYNCLVKEANTDNDLIAKSANAVQEEFRNEINQLKKDAESAKAKAEKN
jgi:hypothetical protein